MRGGDGWFEAGVDDDGFAGGEVGEQGAVAGEHADGEGFAEVGGHTSIVRCRYALSYFSRAK